jgi:putative ABC transport system permease protein
MERMQYMADLAGGATEILVYGEDRDAASDLAAAVAASPDLAGLKVQAWSDRDPWAGILGVAGFVQGILSVIIVFITALGVWNTMTMSVLERTGEIGVLRALGLTRIGAVFLFVFEALGIACLGGVVGVSLGSVGAWLLETYGVQLGDNVVQNAPVPISTRMYGDLNGEIVITAFILGLIMAAIGSAIPAIRAASIQPVTAMRARR